MITEKIDTITRELMESNKMLIPKKRLITPKNIGFRQYKYGFWTTSFWVAIKGIGVPLPSSLCALIDQKRKIIPRVIKLPPSTALITGVRNVGRFNHRSKKSLGITKRRAGKKIVYTKTGSALAKIRLLVEVDLLDVSANLSAIFMITLVKTLPTF